MSKIQETDYWVPEHVRDYLGKLGFHLPLEAMEGYIRAWHGWMAATGDFYDYRDADGFGRIYEVHRRSIHPAMRVCREWGSLLLNDKTLIACDSQECTDWLSEYFRTTGFMPAAQNTVVRAFGLGTGAWALWVDADAGKVRIRHYDASYPKFNKIQAFRDAGLPTSCDALQKLGFSSPLDTAYRSSQEVVKWT